MKRKTIAVLLVITIIMGLSAPAYAVDTPTEVPEQSQEQPQPQEPEQEQTPVVVSTVEELQAAVDAAEDGDTIAISKCIKIKNNSLVTDKEIVLVPADSSVGTLIEMGKDSQLSGFTFRTYMGAIIISNYEGGEIGITNCCFVGEENYFFFLVNIAGGTVQISDCVFKDGKDITLNIAGSSSVTVERCNFTENTTIMQGAGINNMGECYVIDSSFTDNTAGVGGGIYNAGTMEISGCAFSGNKSTDSVGQDVVSTGTLTISDESNDTEGFYNEATGQKVPLPLFASADTAKLIYLTDEQAAEYFSPEVGDEPEATPDPEQPEDEDTNPDIDEPTDPNTPSDTEPSDPESEDGADDNTPDTTPEEPEDNDGGEDIPTQPEQPTQPEDPSDDDDSEDNVNTPVEPSEPPQDNDDSEDDYNPPIYIRPPYRPSNPVLPEPEDPVEPESTPTLVCGEATIDVSRSVVLQGYGDGDLHEEDPLTRAQLATIIYRLLDEASLEKFIVAGETQFADVPADLWCYEYVQTIASAGIVFGVGGGNYDPNGAVTWGQIITVLSRFVEPQEYDLQNIDYDGWALQAVQTAVALGWIEDSADFTPDAVISRGALVQLVNGILEQYRN